MLKALRLGEVHLRRRTLAWLYWQKLPRKREPLTWKMVSSVPGTSGFSNMFVFLLDSIQSFRLVERKKVQKSLSAGPKCSSQAMRTVLPIMNPQPGRKLAWPVCLDATL